MVCHWHGIFCFWWLLWCLGDPCRLWFLTLDCSFRLVWRSRCYCAILCSSESIMRGILKIIRLRVHLWYCRFMAGSGLVFLLAHSRASWFCIGLSYFLKVGYIGDDLSLFQGMTQEFSYFLIVSFLFRDLLQLWVLSWGYWGLWCKISTPDTSDKWEDEHSYLLLYFSYPTILQSHQVSENS